MTETFNLSLEQAHAYEDLFVPVLFAQWVPFLLRHADLAEGADVLDVACGTGVAGRAARELVGADGRVRGVDVNPAMIEVARECAPDIEWTVGDVTHLPYEEDSFDAVLCQSALFFFPDPATACQEMARVLRPGGMLALQTYAGLADQPGYGPFVEAVVRHAGPEARKLLGTYWSQGDAAQVQSLLTASGLEPSSAQSVLGELAFPSVDAFVQTEIQATPLASSIDDRVYLDIVREARTALAGYVAEKGEVRIPIRARFVAGRKPANAR
jgi:SAM-dependent methyltransferase